MLVRQEAYIKHVVLVHRNVSHRIDEMKELSSNYQHQNQSNKGLFCFSRPKAKTHVRCNSSAHHQDNNGEQLITKALYISECRSGNSHRNEGGGACNRAVLDCVQFKLVEPNRFKRRIERSPICLRAHQTKSDHVSAHLHIDLDHHSRVHSIFSLCSPHRIVSVLWNT